MPTRKRRTFDVAPAFDRQLRVVAPRVPSEVRTVYYVGLVLFILRSVKKRMGFGENALLESNVEARDVDRHHEPDIAERMLQVCVKAIGRGLEIAKVYDGDRGEFHPLGRRRNRLGGGRLGYLYIYRSSNRTFADRKDIPEARIARRFAQWIRLVRSLQNNAPMKLRSHLRRPLPLLTDGRRLSPLGQTYRP